jgi:tRNA(Ile)-lysidine synthase TilS/MesJ
MRTSFIRALQHAPKKGDKGDNYFKSKIEVVYISNCIPLVVVALSGGVDSAVTARLLAQKVS